MKQYHICYEVAENLCTGYNVVANSYIKALEKFRKIYNDKNIIYVAKKK